MMIKNNAAFYHKLYGVKKSRVVYYKKDFIDYVLMVLITAVVIVLSYGYRHIMSIIGVPLCIFAILAFGMRHGVEFKVPLILRRPQDLLYMLIYKFRNLRLVYLAAVGLLLLENVLITATPSLPHHVELMRKVALGLFYIHFVSITIFRTAILLDHLAKKELVREVLMQTAWARVIKESTNMTLEVLHAYCTGILTHLVLIAPWYLVITHAFYSVVFLPVTCVVGVLIHLLWLRTTNDWFYRDHWLGHNSELEFIFLHGPHHDAIPSGLIAVAENGYLEGFLRHTIGFPVTFYNPVIACAVYTFEIKGDIELHQYIPGVFPRLSKKVMENNQHSTHHYGPLEPYSLGAKSTQAASTQQRKRAIYQIPEEIRNSVQMDEELTNFVWDNPTYRKTLSLYDKYQK